jgi:hypothetical protein|tara:strand:- start:1267 stop:1476 length:210 start_codon:yes stop_codon:yes gene_type:complete
MYKSKLNVGTTFFNGFKVSWSNATQEELKKVHELGHTNFVTKEENAEPKKSKSKAKKVEIEDRNISDNE